jgi:hypothetical protein|tara:strand:+ start:288 stop:437 length:150 start_codon:yes stop_codon:yes gene_type:complete
MAKKSFKKEKKGNEEEWSWEETSEVREALDRLHRDIRDRVKEANDEQSS